MVGVKAGEKKIFRGGRTEGNQHVQSILLVSKAYERMITEFITAGRRGETSEMAGGCANGES